MAKTRRGQNYHYTFRETEGPSANLSTRGAFNWDCHKQEDDGDGIPVTTYHLWCTNPDLSDLLCDCPASYHHAHRGACKHTGWLRRWKAIQDERAAELEKPSNRRRRDLLSPIYYDAAQDKFYNFPLSIYDDEDE
jgi:hypothetical protein